jgi:hypothetical protein
MSLPTDGSSNEDFRSVIDDLTVANKRLKQKLKKYEKLYDAHLQNDKLFEVRFHGLPDHKKKELEETLRQFVISLDEPKDATDSPTALRVEHTASNTSRPTDPGYASMSASAHNSTSAPSRNAGADRHQMTKSQYNQQQQSIQSYLHDIPAGLLPQPNIHMGENSKKKLVVRRLEQVFAGRRQMTDNRQQPIQQEEVAQSAALDDRRAREASGHWFKEGIREALIMPTALENDDMGGATSNTPGQEVPQSGVATGEQASARSQSPDQRPTRPLDLDPSRAQIPADNMDYIRHLGFALGDVNSSEVTGDGHGWVYLNLLFNMAQLHTINVTPDFVKDALAEYSSKFELSRDGRKVRWKGGNELTLNSDSSSEQLSGASPYHATGSSSRSPSKQLKLEHNGNSTDSIEIDMKGRHSSPGPKEKGRNKFAYTPIFIHRQDSDEDDDLYDGAMTSFSNSPYMQQQRGNSSGFGSSRVRSSSSRKRRDDGPMIFYNKANFCTDMTGGPIEWTDSLPTHAYSRISSQPLGAVSDLHNSTKILTGIGEPRGPMYASSMEHHLKERDSIANSSEEDMDFSLPDLRRNDSSDGSVSAMEFEASGLGGVQPEDNFAIKVRRSQACGEPSSAARTKSKRPRLYPKKILDALDQRESPEERHAQSGSIITDAIISTSRKQLPNSELPPASYLPFDSASSGDVDSDLDSDVSSNPSASSSSAALPAETHHVLDISPLHPSQYGTRQGVFPSEDVSDSSESINLLGPTPRVDITADISGDADYDAEFAERFTKDIPAGSSAATTGGGSGFNSPVQLGNVERKDSSATKQQHHLHTSGSPSSPSANLKRTRTSDSIAVALQEPSKSQKTS